VVVDATGDRATVAPMIGPSFPAVLAAAQRGDAEALGKLWGDLQPRLLRYFAVAASAEADDLASETWLGVIRGLDRFQGSEPAFRAWVFTIARHELLDWRRRAPRWATEDLPADGLVERAAPDDPAADALEGFSTRAVLAEVARLPADQAEAVTLRVVAGLDVQRVAEIMGKSPGAVRVLTHRGLRRLAARMGTEDLPATGLVEQVAPDDSAAMPVEALGGRPPPDDPAEAALEPQSTRARPYDRAGRSHRWSSVSRCVLSLLVCWVLWPSGLVRRMRYSAALAERLVAYAVGLQPARYRDHYQATWLGELDWLKAQKCPVLGWAIGVAGTAVFTRLELRARLAGAAGRLRELPKSRPARAVRRAKPIWLGILTAVSVFCAAAVGWSGAGQQGATRAQLLWGISASVLAGGGMTWQTWPRGPAADELPKAEELQEDERP
jgi:RNA polymerase sigma-70 factor (ECF subfamily)